MATTLSGIRIDATEVRRYHITTLKPARHSYSYNHAHSYIFEDVSQAPQGDTSSRRSWYSQRPIPSTDPGTVGSVLRELIKGLNLPFDRPLGPSTTTIKEAKKARPRDVKLGMSEPSRRPRLCARVALHAHHLHGWRSEHVAGPCICRIVGPSFENT